MNNKEAKFILSAYRPNGQDVGEPGFAEALQQAQTDPQLKAWFTANLKWDAWVGEALRATPLPSDLETSILAGQKVVPMQQNRKGLRWVAAAAAVMLLGLTGVMLSVRHFERPSFFALRQDLPDVMASFKELALKTEDVGKVRAYLASEDAHADLEIPVGLEGVPSLGCCVLDWHERKIALVCFRMEEPPGQVAHLLVMDARDVRNAPDGRPICAEQPAWSTAGWSQGDHVYLLATASGGRSARSIVSPAF